MYEHPFLWILTCGDVPSLFGGRKRLSVTPCSRVLLEKLTGFHLVKKFPAFYGTRRFITAFTSDRHKQVPGSVRTFRNNACFYGDELLAPRPTPKLEDHPLSALHDCLFNIFAATLSIGGCSSIRHPRTSHAVVTVTHLPRVRKVLDPNQFCFKTTQSPL
jgi:hypothetical protein